MSYIFDIVNSEENNESQKKLFRLIESGEAVLFVGSGISRRLGYPSWEGLLKDLSLYLLEATDKTLVGSKITNGELLIAAEIIKSKITPTDYNSAFEEIFGLKEPSHDDFHKLLVSLKFKGFVTTNYDPVIESALKSIQVPKRNYGITICSEQRSYVHAFLNSLVRPVNYKERHHLFLHGRYNLPDSTILSYGDYVQKYHGLNIQDQIELYDHLVSGNIDIKSFELKSNLKNNAFRTLHYKAIYLLFVTQRLVFTGFGLRDDFLNKIIDDIREDFDPLTPNHFALFSKNDYETWNQFEFQQEKRRWREKGVELVFFDDDTSYNGIVEFFRRLSPESYVSPDTILTRRSNEEIKAGDEDPVAHKKIVDDESVNFKLMAKTKKTAQELKKK